ncbi:beta-phosphoglucomutase [Bowmanella dokdonensis]|uniref:Beta-phosphoglucomutase n=1 Tax=Bowmanella dokdonensis TaxID=751969 RepID=A0A939DKL6_9ALTE|nr:beta-phosphoglucomutase [Bowmanella dokdonensis]MBN7824037.1 beta-phosphoglucomutase [Bowmanella dokdonensis]
MSIQAFIFDLDGVLTDTAEYHFLAWKALADELGIPFDRHDNEALKGVDRMGSLSFILSKGELELPEEQVLVLADKKNRHYQQLIEHMSPADLFAGAHQLFADLKSRRIAIGLASASKNAPMVLDRLGIADQFDYVADAAKVKQGKPHPEIFLTVADALTIAPQDCVGIEDSLAGLQSIQDAGMHSVGIGDKQVLNGAEQVYAQLHEVDLAEVLALGKPQR